MLLQLWIRSRGAHLTKKQETNIYALKGKRAIVVEAIEQNKPGYISISGILWLARSATNTAIAKGKWVEIVSIQGAHALVIEVSKESN